MNVFRIFFTTAIALILATLCGCGGGAGDGGATTSPPPTGGIGRNGIAVGPITTFGSVAVNGVAYNTDSATFTVNDAVAAQADLAVGDVVVVSGTIDENGTTGTATAVVFDDVVTGPVDSINVADNSLVVLGQTVLVNSDTSFDDNLNPASLSGLSVGQIVEVSGQVNANDNIVATRIEPKPAGTQFEVHGTVAGLDSANMLFTLGSLTVDYSTATLDDFPAGQITNGDFVEAKGTSIGAAGELTATLVELESLVPGANDGDRVEIEGYITRFTSATDFDVAAFPVTTNANTEFEGGVAADLGLNLKVEVEGDIDATGLITATELDIRRATTVRATANVDSINAAADTLVLLGITVSVDALTRFEDKSDEEVDPLTLGDINVGDYVEVRGSEFPASSGDILATILERDDADTEVTLQGLVESVSDPAYTVLGVTINTNSGTTFRDENDLPITSVDFFNRLAIGLLVEANGTETSDRSISAVEIEIQDES